ncbi:MAG: hypothetical protein Q7J10_01355 [Methanosarcinaceae archaeon]|nr:hypothetical protein [Methanosarcinaceae archaeon]
MLIRKNISLDEKYLKKLQPLMDVNGGNLSAAIRDTIELTDVALQNHGTIEESIVALNTPVASPARFDDLLENGEHLIINRTALKWLIKNSSGCLIDEELVDELINPFSIQTMMELDIYLNNLSQEFGWGIEVSIFCMDPIDPDTATITFSNGDSYLRDFFAEHIALFLAKWKQLDIDDLYRRSKSIRIDFKKSTVVPDEVPSGIMKHFGHLDPLHKELHKKEVFWVGLVNAYKTTGYNMVAIPKNHFESIAAGDVPDGTTVFEKVTNHPIEDIPLSELLVLFKRIFSVSQIVNNIEIHLEPGNESVKIQHDYRDEKTIMKLIQYFTNIFEANGHKFDVTHSSSLMIFKRQASELKL